MTVSEDELADRKAAARKAASAARKAARDAAGPGAPAALSAIFAGALEPLPGTTVSGFLPIGSEIDPRPALRHLRVMGCEICLPCVVAPDAPLVFRAWQENDTLVEESFGTRAPAPSAPERVPDILMVPMLAFDDAGYRLGYGGGFYDRSLEALRAVKRVVAVGVAYSGQRVDAVPRGDFDQPLDWIVTQSGAFRPGQPGNGEGSTS